MKYRADIDGLRAIAVLPVLFFHIDPAFLPGGFAGVDVFFVISGFLITRIISEQITNGSFTLSGFYRNRINRIFPALFAVVLLSLLFGLLVMSPQDLLMLAKSAVSTVFGVSNIFFWKEYGGYFSAAAHEAPLLHTWSLAVEEQFYVVWPLLLMVLLGARLRRHAPLLLTLFVLAFVGVSEMGTRLMASASYYLLPTRIFELALGGLVGFLLARGPIGVRPALNMSLAVIGLGLVLGSFVLLRGTGFPGFNAVYPCLGAALLIVAGGASDNWVSRLLARRAFVLVGLLSYSLYLWHWPIIAAFNYFYLESGIWRTASIVLLSFLMAWLSWRFVEQPFRRGREPFRQVFVRRYLLPVAILGLGVAVLVASHGLPQRFPLTVTAMEAAVATRPNLLRERCHSPSFRFNTPPHDSCVLGAVHEPVSGLLIGDSFANHFTAMMDEVARAAGIALQDYTMDACLPLVGFAQGPQPDYADKCLRRNEANYALVGTGRYRYVVLGGEWPEGGIRPHYLQGREVTQEVFMAELQHSLRVSLQRIVASGAIPVVILRNFSIPNADSCPIRQVTLRLARRCDAIRPISSMDVVWSRMALEQPTLRFIDPNALLCPQERCQVLLQGVPLYRDNGHLNDAGSRLIGQMLVQAGEDSLAGAAVVSANP